MRLFVDRRCHTLSLAFLAITSPSDCVLKDQDCTGGKTCCQPVSPDTMTCEAVNQWYSKCVFQPQCVNATNTNPTKKCEGTADQIMNETACCDATESCVPFGDTWKMCRTSDIATCSVTGEQCWGKNDMGQSTPPTNKVYKQISSSLNKHVCGIEHDTEDVSCWGSNIREQVRLGERRTYAVRKRRITTHCVSRRTHQLLL